MDRQKLMAKGAWTGILKDDADMTTMKIKEGQQIMLMGTAEVVAAPAVEVFGYCALLLHVLISSHRLNLLKICPIPKKQKLDTLNRPVYRT